MSTDGYKKGAKVYMVTAIKKRAGYTISEGRISTDVDQERTGKQSIYVKYPSPHDAGYEYEHQMYVALTDMSKAPWKLTPEEAVSFALEAKAASITKYHRAIKTVEGHIEILRGGKHTLYQHTPK